MLGILHAQEEQGADYRKSREVPDLTEYERRSRPPLFRAQLEERLGKLNAEKDEVQKGIGAKGAEIGKLEQQLKVPKDIAIVEIDELFTYYKKRPNEHMYGLLLTETETKLLISR